MNFLAPSSARGLRRLQVPRPFKAAIKAPGHSVYIEERTGPLEVIEGARALVIFDMENLALGARDLGCTFLYTQIAKILKQACSRCYLHAFFSREAGDETDANVLRAAGYTPHPRDIETVVSRHGVARLANSDNFIMFFAGMLSSRIATDVVVLASGDGTLVCDLARAIKDLPKTREVATLSLPGSTSRRLDAAKNKAIVANIEIGRDCLATAAPHSRQCLARPQWRTA